MKQKQRKRWGDRKDGRLLRDLPAMNFVMGMINPKRADNEAFISERIDLTNIKAYLEKKNAGDPMFKYTFFHVIVAATAKTIMLRPRLNWFIQNGSFYERNKISIAFVVKKQFTDESGEALAFLYAKEDDTMDSIHEEIFRHVSRTRSGKSSGTEDTMEILKKLPRFLSKAALRVLVWLDKHGWVPAGLVAGDPSYSSAFISNLGSIKLRSGYHHLSNWGTNSLFCVIGEKKMTPAFAPDGAHIMRETLDLGLTIDERLADGYYYSKSIQLMKYLLEHPEELDKPLGEEVSEWRKA